MEGNLPVGGKWNYDDRTMFLQETWPSRPVDPIFFKSDAITKEAIKEVENAFPENPDLSKTSIGPSEAKPSKH